MDKNLCNEIIYGLERGTMTILDVHVKCINKNMSYDQAQQFLYCLDRPKRFELFIALYNATLKNDPFTAFEVFREAYCASDNIYMKIKNSKMPFVLKDFLKFINSKGVNFYSIMNKDEKKYYDELPSCFTIYRGISQKEQESEDYGISWSLSKEEAINYIYFDKNNVEDGEGGLINTYVKKEDILTVFCVDGKKEIIYLYNNGTAVC